MQACMQCTDIDAQQNMLPKLTAKGRNFEGKQLLEHYVGKEHIEDQVML